MVGRLAAVGALVLAVVLVAVVVLGGGDKRRYRMTFQTAGQLVKGDEVQVGGRAVGTIKDIELTTSNDALVEIEVEEPFAPLHEGTTGIIRATSLSGVANRYIALTPGPNSGGELDDDAVLGTDRTTTPVDLDQLFNTLDPRTRKGLQNVVQGFATWYEGKGKQANEAARYFSPALSTTARLTEELTKDQGALTAFVVNTSKAMTALAERRDDLASLVSNGNTTFGAIAAENDGLSRALTVLPSTLRRANTTFVNLRATLDDLDVLVDESKPATRELAPFLRELRPLVRSARPTIADLSALIRRPGANNDAVEATRQLPALQRTATPAFRNSVGALKRSQPFIETVRPYAPEFVGWLRGFGQAASPYDANGHYARVSPIFNALSFTDSPAGGVLTPKARGTGRLDGLQTGKVKKCPGAAIQAPADGSAPFLDSGALGPEDCDPTILPPGAP